MTDPSTPPQTKLKLSLRGCHPGLPAELQTIYPEVWRRLCALAAETHVRFDLDAGELHRRGPNGRWRSFPSSREGQSLLAILNVIHRLPKRSCSADSRLGAVILAGGKGSRFGEGQVQKVLHPVKGVPAIDRILNRCRDAGCQEIVFVLGWQWREVLDHLESADENLHYVLQPEPLGTGDAARYGARYLAAQAFEGDVLVIAGDKVLSETAIPDMLEKHRARNADMTLTTASKEAWPGSGRVLLDEDGRVLAIFEQPDVARDRILGLLDDWPEESFEAGRFLDAARAIQNNAKKLRKSLGDEVCALLESGGVSLDGLRQRLAGILRGLEVAYPDGRRERLSGETIEAECGRVNVSLYAFRAGALSAALERLEAGNAQGEYYLTDAARLLAEGWETLPQNEVVACDIEDDAAGGFNTLAELANIESRL